MYSNFASSQKAYRPSTVIARFLKPLSYGLIDKQAGRILQRTFQPLFFPRAWIVKKCCRERFLRAGMMAIGRFIVI